MAKKIIQFRYYKEDSDKNFPKNVSGFSNINQSNLKAGSIFNNCLPITQLGIQSLPGTKFYLNNSKDPIIIGSTGIYELDLEGISEITQINFDGNSIQAINTNPNAYLIIDMIYDNNK